MAPPIRVLVVDDSAFMRTAVARTLASEKGIEVIGQAKDGAEAVERVRELRPDVVTMDFNMPRMNGAQAIRAIFDERPVPIVMLSAHTYDGAKETLEALRAGAVDFVTKPDGEVSTDLASIKDELLRKIKAAAKSRPMQAPPQPAAAPRAGPPSGSFQAYTPAGETTERRERISFSSILDPAVIIAVSTGGPAALEQVIPKLPSDFPHGVLVVQHMPAQFTRALASRLDSIAKLTVREAQDGDRIMAGSVLVAPGDRHVVVDKSGMLKLTGTAPVNGCRPSADVTLQTAAPIYGSRLTAVIMTGMGRDGALGATSVKAARGRIVVQDRETSVVYGMPKAVAEMGIADEEVSLDGIAVSLIRHADRHPT